MKKNSSFKNQDKPFLTPHEAAKDLIRPYFLTGDTTPLRASSNFSTEKEDYSAKIENGKVVITMLYGTVIRVEFLIGDILQEITKEFSRKTPPFQSHTKEKYQEREKEIKILMNILAIRLEKHKKKFDTNSSNWAYVGDLQYITALLKNILSFLN